jgi:PAS domain S-box-containing protein
MNVKLFDRIYMTENNKLAAELGEKIDLLEETLYINKLGHWELNIKTNEIKWSNMVYDIHELPRNSNLDKTQGINFYHPDYQEKVKKAVEKCIVDGIPFNIECILITNKKKEKWVRATGRKNGDKLIGSFQDISDIKNQELKFKGIFNSTFTFIGFLDPNGILLEANDTAVNLAGLKHSDVIGKYFWDCYWWQISKETQEELKVNFKKAVAGQTLEYEVVVWIANQTPITILFTLKPVFDEKGKVIYVIPEGRPVQELVNARIRYKSVLEGTNVGTWEWNVQTGETIFNERWAEIVGYTLEELAPISIETWMKLAHPDDLEESGKRLTTCFEKQSEFYDFEARMRHKDGHWVWVYDRGKVFEWTADGKPLWMYGTHQDITQRKLKEEELRTVLRITEEQNDRLKNFAQIVSHNLRSHSGGIYSLKELLIAEHPNLKDTQILRLLSVSIENLKQTVEDLTEIVKVNLAAEELKPIQLFAILEKNVISLSSQIRNTGIKIINEIPETVQVKGITAYIDSICLNLITNAIKYRSEDRASFLRIYCEENESSISIFFRDNGLGIDLNKHRDKIFGMYKTFHQHEDSRGVGLFITKNQVESMGGKIHVESEVNVGTTFKITLRK